MKRFYARYTPEMVSTICGCSADDFLKTAELITSTYTPDRAGTIMYALGWTHHSHSVQLIHAAAMLQLLLGNIGRPGGGLNALRGHANIQGGTDCGMAYHNLPGYIPVPKADHDTLGSVPHGRDAESRCGRTPRTSGPAPTGSWSASSRRTTAPPRRSRTTSATISIRSCRSRASGGYENWSWAYIFDHMYPRRHGGLLQLRDEPGQQRPALTQSDRRALQVEMDGGRRELRAGNVRVLAARYPRRSST